MMDKQPGYYWIRFHENSPWTVAVVRFVDGNLRIQRLCDDGTFHWPLEPIYEWGDRIPTPEERI